MLFKASCVVISAASLCFIVLIYKIRIINLYPASLISNGDTWSSVGSEDTAFNLFLLAIHHAYINLLAPKLLPDGILHLISKGC